MLFQVSHLRRQLRNKSTLLGDGVSRSFLCALVQLIGGYRDALNFHEGECITFNKDAFIESRPVNMQPFLRKMLELQIFQQVFLSILYNSICLNFYNMYKIYSFHIFFCLQFIEERLEMLNAGLGFSDEFEMEVCNYHEKSSNKLKQQYREWKFTVKREGTAFLKTVKNVVSCWIK